MTADGRHSSVETTDESDRAYDELAYWSDGRLIETYRRLSNDLRRTGFDAETVHRMGRVEERMRARGLDPDPIAEEVAEFHRNGSGP